MRIRRDILADTMLLAEPIRLIEGAEARARALAELLTGEQIRKIMADKPSLVWLALAIHADAGNSQLIATHAEIAQMCENLTAFLIFYELRKAGWMDWGDDESNAPRLSGNEGCTGNVLLRNPARLPYCPMSQQARESYTRLLAICAPTWTMQAQ